jgi:hypothetical protein
MKLRDASLQLADCYLPATADILNAKIATTHSSLKRVRPNTILLNY